MYTNVYIYYFLINVFIFISIYNDIFFIGGFPHVELVGLARFGVTGYEWRMCRIGFFMIQGCSKGRDLKQVILS